MRRGGRGGVVKSQDAAVAFDSFSFLFRYVESYLCMSLQCLKFNA